MKAGHSAGKIAKFYSRIFKGENWRQSKLLTSFFHSDFVFPSVKTSSKFFIMASKVKTVLNLSRGPFGPPRIRSAIESTTLSSVRAASSTSSDSTKGPQKGWIHQGDSTPAPAKTAKSSSNLSSTSINQTAATNNKSQQPKLKTKQPAEANRWLSYERHDPKPTAASVKEKNITISSYYNSHAIDEAAKMASIRLTPATIMYSGTRDNPKRSVQYLQKELPIRIAHRIHGIRSLPFVVASTPAILAVHELYIRAFHILSKFPEVKTEEDEAEFCILLRQLMDDHKDVVANLAQGFKECQRYITDDTLVRRYLDGNLTSRLGIRMLVTHHLHLREQKDGHIGIINMQMHLREVIQHWASFVKNLTEQRYGVAPSVRISGHVSARFPYIEMPLDYILPELLKNAFRATVESHKGMNSENLPPINIYIASNEVDFIVKVSDRGGGISHHNMDKVLQYNFSTAEESIEKTMDDDIFGNMMEVVNRTTTGPMHGYGFGLPTSRAYAQYLGGDLQVQTMQGLGTDVYLRLKHFNSKAAPFRI